MKQVDFYLIGNAVKQAKYKLASRLANKLIGLNQRCLLVCDTEQELETLDATLWSFSDASFVAHDRVPSQAQTHAQVHISVAQQVNSHVLDSNYDVLISLCQNAPLYVHHFARIAEVIEADEAAKQAGRQRFRHYKSEGFELKTHQLEL